MGTIYRRKWKAKDGTIKENKNWWIKYYRKGQPYYEATRFTKESHARKLLKKREGEIADGKLPGINLDKVTFEELAEDYLNHYKINNQSVGDAKLYVEKHLRPVFGNYRMVDITTAAINKYVKDKLEEGKANATINRHLSALSKMFNLGKESEKVYRIPVIKRLKEDNVRTGFFERDQFERVRNELPDHLKGVATFGYVLGWRRSEITTLEWAQVDRKNGIVRLEPGTTKNKQARTVYLDKELKEVIEWHWQYRKEKGSALPWVFLNRSGSDRVKTFGKAWKSACKRAGVGYKIFHDFRRTAARDMVRATVPEKVAMQITGHKTRSVFDRYNIVSDKDVRKASKDLEKYRNSKKVTKTVTVSHLP